MIMLLSKLVPSISYISNTKSKEAFSIVELITNCFIHGKSSFDIYYKVIKDGNKKVVFFSYYHPKFLTTTVKYYLTSSNVWKESAKITKLLIPFHLKFRTSYINIASAIPKF